MKNLADMAFEDRAAQFKDDNMADIGRLINIIQNTCADISKIVDRMAGAERDVDLRRLQKVRDLVIQAKGQIS